MIFDRLRKDVRVRVSGILVRDGRVLLVAHRKSGNVYWLIPGGGVVFGESLEEALVREMEEELNVSVAIDGLAFVCDSIHPSGDRHILNICFFCRYLDGEYRLGKDRRLHDFRFFPREEIAGLMLYPPINDQLVRALDRGDGAGYLGRIWIN